MTTRKRASRTRYIHIQTFAPRIGLYLNNCVVYTASVITNHMSPVCAFLVLYKDELISTQDHVTAETHAAKLASRRPTRYLYTETVNDFNNCVVHTASVVTNLYTSPVCAFLVLYNAVLNSTQGHVTAESLSLRPPSWRVVVRSVTCTRKPQMTSTTVLFTRLQL